MVSAFGLEMFQQEVVDRAQARRIGVVIEKCVCRPEVDDVLCRRKMVSFVKLIKVRQTRIVTTQIESAREKQEQGEAEPPPA